MQLTLGPVLFNWESSAWRDFYARIADEAPVDSVCIGEVVCSKRQPFFETHMPEAIDRLTRGGKTVVLSSPILVTLPRERRQTASLADDAERLVEANDVTCLRPLVGRPHWIGPFVNVYNEGTLAWVAANGARRVCLPPELPMASIAALAQACPDVELEVWGFGRVPLAISARCYHARLHKLSKDNCRFVCVKDPDGLEVDTLDDERFLAVNGVQTLSSSFASLLTDLPALASAGVASCRISPHTWNMAAVAEIFRSVLDGRLDPDAGSARLAALCPSASFSNGFLRGPGSPGWSTHRSSPGTGAAGP